jgi:hypothetical protein
MPRLSLAVPKYSLHKGSNQAVVYLDNDCHYLGPFCMLSTHVPSW